MNIIQKVLNLLDVDKRKAKKIVDDFVALTRKDRDVRSALYSKMIPYVLDGMQWSRDELLAREDDPAYTFECF